ncbi:MAG: elongation factor P [Proteobacteria bacterium]|nr:elongation factor P [Pseudomonadota bacterium]MDA1058979.1 elongation factor P [Pseudomonadota bacterium]
MKINANQIRPGMVIEYEGRQMAVIKIQLIQPGKGGAFIAVEMRDLTNGVKTNQRWRTADTVEKLNTEEHDYQYLFAEADSFTFMDPQSYEQITIAGSLLGDDAAYLEDGMTVRVNSVEGVPIGIQLPATVILEVMEAEPVVKGQTASSSYKPAQMSNGLRVMVPPFVETGTRIVVNTADGTYLKRTD